MKKTNYKGRCEKKMYSKCKGVCKTYSKLQSAFADMLEEDEEVISFECNVPIEDYADSLYTTDFVTLKRDGTRMVRECVWRTNLLKVSYGRLLDISRNYWMDHGVTDWGKEHYYFG